MDTSRHYQTVTLRLDDGREGTFTGPVLVTDGTNLPKLVGVIFSSPIPLADGVHFETLAAITKTDRETQPCQTATQSTKPSSKPSRAKRTRQRS